MSLTTVETQRITLVMMRPPGRSQQADLEFTELKNYWFGPATEEFSDQLRQGHSPLSLLDRFGARLDEHFFNVYEDKFKLSPAISGTAYTSAQGVRIGIVKDSVQHVSRLRRDPLRSELSNPSLRPSHLLLAIEGGQDGKDFNLAVNGRRSFILELAASAQAARSGNGVLGTELIQLEYLLDERLYQRGVNPTKALYAYHEQGTNRVRKVVGRISEPASANEEIKAHELQFRVVPGIGKVLTKRREKNLVAATKKACSIAALGDGVIRAETVKDLMGIEMVSRAQDRDNLMENIVTIIKGEYKLKDEDIKEDHVTEKDRGQGGVRFKRLQISLPGFATALEWKFETYTGFLNGQVEVGRMGDDGFLQGRAHALYKLRRDDPAADYIVDKEFDGVDIHAELRKAQHHITEDLMAEGTRVVF